MAIMTWTPMKKEFKEMGGEWGIPKRKYKIISHKANTIGRTLVRVQLWECYYDDTRTYREKLMVSIDRPSKEAGLIWLRSFWDGKEHIESSLPGGQ